jgi:hypothetical protein
LLPEEIIYIYRKLQLVLERFLETHGERFSPNPLSMPQRPLPEWLGSPGRPL